MKVESLLDDKDFRCPITRAEFEELSSDLFHRVTKPVEEALNSAQMDLVSFLFKISASEYTKSLTLSAKQKWVIEQLILGLVYIVSDL